MTEAQQLANRFREVFLNGTWIANTNYKDILSDVTLEQATTKIGDLNTIALLTCHINYYVAGVLQVYRGGDLEIRDKFSFDFVAPKSEDEWQQIIQNLIDNSETFASQIDGFSEAKLRDVFVKEDYGNYRRNVDGMIEHAYYHLGQISLIKKIVKQKA